MVEWLLLASFREPSGKNFFVRWKAFIIPQVKVLFLAVLTASKAIYWLIIS